MRILLLPLLLLGALAGGAVEAADGGKPWAILPLDQTRGVLHQCSRRSPRETAGPFWSPSVAQIEELERGLPAYLRKQGHAKQANGLDTYRRQYVGFVRAGRKLVYLNAFSAEMADALARLCGQLSKARGSRPCSPDTWRREAMHICDGGDSVWGLEYDPASKAFDHLDFNGVA